ncbi:MAG: PAN domain-containing protein [Leptolyngbya sp. IPPAS B-1204]|nr:MAG: hypothetical protein EDM05_12595 [Leptolyngbya sp. IPPAS B-1204]
MKWMFVWQNLCKTLSRKKLVFLSLLIFLTLSLVGIGNFFLLNQPANAQRSDELTVEFNTDRPGRDYRDFDLSQPCATRCQAACADDSDCVAYTYVKPGVQGSKARCWLKDRVASPTRNSCCISGVKD